MLFRYLDYYAPWQTYVYRWTSDILACCNPYFLVTFRCFYFSLYPLYQNRSVRSCASVTSKWWPVARLTWHFYLLSPQPHRNRTRRRRKQRTRSDLWFVCSLDEDFLDSYAIFVIIRAPPSLIFTRCPVKLYHLAIVGLMQSSEPRTWPFTLRSVPVSVVP